MQTTKNSTKTDNSDSKFDLAVRIAKGIIEKIRERFPKDYYVKRIAANVWVWVSSAALALFFTMVSYPGILYSDSYKRITTAKTIQKIIEGTWDGSAIQSWVTAIPSLFIAESLHLTGHIALYTFFQAFFFFAATFLLIKRLARSYKLLQCILFAVSPMIYCVSVYYEAGIGCVTGIVFFILLLDRLSDKKDKVDRVIEFLLFAFSSYIIFGYRANALSIIPVFVVYIIYSRNSVKVKRLACAALAVGLLFVWATPRVLKINTMSSSVAGFVWEMVTMIQRMDPEDQAKYITYLDEVGGDGSTKSAVKNNIDISINGFIWGKTGLNTQAVSAKGASGIILKKYFKIMFERPGDYIKVKWDFTKHTLGMGEPIRMAEYDYNRWDRMDQYGFNDSPQREKFAWAYTALDKKVSFYTRRPWVGFLVSMLLVGFEWYRKNKRRKLYLLVLATAMCYYFMYVLNTQSYEIRYYYPSLYLLMILDVALLVELIKEGVTFLWKKYKEREGTASAA